MNIAMPEDNIDQEWQLFLTKIEEYCTHPSSKWTAYTLLAYFLVKYKKNNGLEFTFSYGKRGPTKSRELKQATIIWKMFDKGRYKQYNTKEDKEAYKEQLVNILKSYINWAFDVKFHGRQINITGLGIFAVSNFMNEFLQWRKINSNLLPRRSDPISQEFLNWVNDTIPELFKKQQLKVLEDLNALVNYVKAYDEYNTSIEAIVLQKARDIGIMPLNGKIELQKK